MEDSNLDWENLDYSPDSLEDAGETEKSSGFGWILSRGLSLGKKLVITGVVLSSAPVVVPPLFVVSALGFAFSVPFGFMYASYACTQKLMSKLLPQAVMPNEVGKEENEQLDDDAVAGVSADMRNHQEELAYDNHKVVLLGKEPDVELSTELRKDGELKKGDINGEDANEVAAGDIIMVTSDNTAASSVAYKGNMKSEGNANTEMIIEGVEVEGSPSGDYGTRAADMILPVQTLDLKSKQNDNSSKKEIVQIDSEDKIDTKLGEREGKDVRGLKEADKGKKRHTNGKGKKKTPKTQKRVQGDISKAQEKEQMKNENVASENDLNVGIGRMELSPQVVGEMKIKEALSDCPTEEHEAGHSQEDVSQSMAEEINKNVIEAGDLSVPFEEVQESNKNIELLASETANKVSVSNFEGVGFGACVEASEPVLKQHKDLPYLKDNDTVHEADNGLHSDKVVLRDEEIWKQIDSIREIVGFKLPRHTSYFEELKALYLFTGIEPPSLFKDPFDIVEVCDKLRFLMSVIGVK